MKKTVTILMLSIVSYVGYAQEKTGINTTSPKTTLDVAGSPADANALDGIMAPRLTGDQLKAKTYTADQKGAVVYVTAAASTTNQTGQTVNVKGEGQYMFNGLAWVKVTGQKGQLWAEGKNTDGSPYYYLAPAADLGDTIAYMYKPKEKSLYSTSLTSRNFPMTIPNSYWAFNDAGYFIEANHIDSANNKDNEVRYQAQFRGVYTDNAATRRIRHLLGGTNIAALGDPTNVANYTAGTTLTTIDAGAVAGFVTRADNYSSGKVDNLFGLQTFSKNYGKGNVDYMYGIHGYSWNTGSVKDQHGLKMDVKLFENSSAERLYGGVYNINATNGSLVNNSVQGIRADVIIDGATVDNIFSHGLRNILHLKNGGTMKFFEGVQTTLYTEAGTSLDEYKGFRMFVPSSNAATIKNMYGLYLDSVDKGTTTNYAIYTNAGDVRLGDLTGTGERIVMADADGVLKTGTTTVAQATSKWTNDATNTYVKLTNLSDGQTPRNNQNYFRIKDDGTVNMRDFVSVGWQRYMMPTSIEQINISASTAGSRVTYNNMWNGTVNKFVAMSYDNQPTYVGSHIFRNNEGVFEMSGSSAKINNGDPVVAEKSFILDFKDNTLKLGKLNSIHSVDRALMSVTDKGSLGMYKIAIPQTDELVSTLDLGVRSGGLYQNLASIKTVSLSDSYVGADKVSNLSAGLAFYTLPLSNNLGNDEAVLQERMRITADGSVGIGTKTPTANFTVRGKDGENAEIVIERFNDDANGANLTLIKSRGTAASPQGVTVGQSLGRFRTGGYSGYPQNNASQVYGGIDGFASNIETIVAAAPTTSGHVPTNMKINLTQNSGVRRTIFTMLGDNGYVGVGTNPTQKLEVAGNIKATSFIAGTQTLNVPDYVFEDYYNGKSVLNPAYQFKTLNEVEDFVKAKGHLPGYQSAKEIKENGTLDMTVTQLTNIEKIEELYLHTIEQEKKIEAQQKENKVLRQEVEELKTLVKQLIEQL